MDEVFVISRLIKVEASVISRGWLHLPRPLLFRISQTPNSIIVLLCIVLRKIYQKLFCEMQVDNICASKNTRPNAPSSLINRNHSGAHALHPKVYQLRMRTARGIICTYNWIADYTIIMLVYKIMWILKISRGPLADQNADSEYNV